MATPVEIKSELNRLYNDPLTSNGGQLVPDIVPAILNLLQSTVGGGGGSSDATAANQVTGNATLTNILTQLQGDRTIASQLFTDATNTVYLRVLAFNTTTSLYESTTVTLAGAAYTPTLPETPILQADVDTVETTWEIVTSGVGYTTGDIVSQFSLVKQGTPPTVAAVLWYNQNTSAAIASPVLAHRRRLGVSAATETTLSAVSASLTSIDSLSFDTVDRLDSIRDGAIKKAAIADFGIALTPSVGSNYESLAPGSCTEVLVLNLDATAVDLEIRRGSSGATIILPFGTSMLFEAITDSNQIQFRRADTLNNQLIVRFERRTR